MVSRVSPFLLAILVAAAACGGAEDGRSDELALSPEVDEAIDAAYGRFATAYELGDAGMVAGLYTPDALYLPPQGDVLRGRPAIRASFESFFDAAMGQGVDVRISFTSVERRGDVRLVYDVGYYTLEFQNEGRAFATSRGKFTTLWKPGADGRWRIHVDAFNPAESPEQPADTTDAPGDTAPGDTGAGPAGRSGGSVPP